MELFIQLAIIMVGKQIFNAILEMVIPIVKKKYRKIIFGCSYRNDEKVGLKAYSQWTKDYNLLAWESMSLFREYLEMILQFG